MRVFGVLGGAQWPSIRAAKLNQTHSRPHLKVKNQRQTCSRPHLEVTYLPC
uniref:Uncharacterized protein n=1 Tax=Solanum tuberosum TaxID=4113 RepID=M1ARM1_SOLTU